MPSSLEELMAQPPLSKIPAKNGLRVLSFNVNGANTLFKYHPWNEMLLLYDAFFRLLQADIVLLQELKLSPTNISTVNIGNLTKYRSFISLPKQKRGYSGVGLFIRNPTAEDTESTKTALTVVHAEEGITGFLKSPDLLGLRYLDLPENSHIGGYDTDMDPEEALKIDSEGRCVAVELACNTVVFSLYCPANSIATEEGEQFRLRFLGILLQRCYTIKHKLKKDVIIIGDINVSLDLIDHAESISERAKEGLITTSDLKAGNGLGFEDSNYAQCIAFKLSRPARKLLNTYTKPTLALKNDDTELPTQFLYDSTRIYHKRRVAMYTVWNTLTNSRQSNYGSRIDLILTSSDILSQSITNADILPYLNGSDHCPVFTDFDVLGLQSTNKAAPNKLPFEAKYFFKLVKHHDISQMFGRVQKKRALEPRASENKNTELSVRKETPKLVYLSRKKQATSDKQISIGSFFFTDGKKTSASNTSSPSFTPPPSDSMTAAVKNAKPLSISSISSMIHGEPPKCHHKQACELKTSLSNSKTRGKKFWSCAKPLMAGPTLTNEELSDDYKCNFFEWANIKKT